ncbi:hypothetical protein [Phyllobacterium endophyticum]|uniref:hypothetical protein n=1 Tax=Phyllobacterium endophyticum TaxID=1149773 RepID=UPI001AEEF833|nr:hypothetical protein [Phyllobacterium endophyticum]
MTEKKKYPVRTTRKGTLIWPHFNKPDTKFATDPRGEYRGTLRLSDEDFEAIKPIIDDHVSRALAEATDKNGNHLEGLNLKKATAKGPSYPYKKAMDKDGNDLPGWDINFKCSWGGQDNKTGEEYSNKPKQFDCANPPKKIDVFLSNGAIVKISYTMYMWATAGLGYGVTLRPKAIQVIRLAAKGEADADYYGFESDEDGFEHDDEGASDFTEKKQDTVEEDEFSTSGQTTGYNPRDLDDEIPF